MIESSIALQLVLNMIIAGGLYALVATGYTLVQATLKFVNFQHGALTALGAFIVYQLYIATPVLDFVSASIVSVLVVAAVGFTIERVAYKPLRVAPSITPLMASMGLAICISSAILLFWGPWSREYGISYKLGKVEIFGATTTTAQVMVIGVSLLSLAFLHFFVTKTKIGTAARAVAENREISMIMGIDIDKVISIMFSVVSALAALSGIMIGVAVNIYPGMGGPIIVKTFAATMLGGIGNIPGAIIGSFLIAAVENLGSFFISSGYKDAYAYIIMIAVLLIRPAGLLKRKEK